MCDGADSISTAAKKVWKILLCYFHIKKAIKNNIPNDLKKFNGYIMWYIKLLNHTNSLDEFNHLWNISNLEV